MKRIRLFCLLPLVAVLFVTCAEPVISSISSGPRIPRIDDDTAISIITWNIREIDANVTQKTKDRVQLIMDSLDADFYCLQEIEQKSALQDIVDNLDRYSAIISNETRYDHLAIIYKNTSFLPVLTEDLFKNDDYNFAGRPPLMVNFIYSVGADEHILNLIDLHMKCCEANPSDLERRHAATNMLHDWLRDKLDWGDSNFVVVGDWNDDIYDTDGSGEYAFEALLEDPEHFYFVTDSLAATGTARNSSYPSWPSFLDNILISESLFDEYNNSTVEVLRLDEVFGDYTSVVSDHRPVLWSFTPN